MTTDLEEVRKNIKSCLIAVQGTSTIELLEKDYQQHTYDKIPHYKLGYCSTEAFLRSLTDLVHVTGNSKSAVVTLLRTKDSKSQHLEDLVAEQRPDKKFRERFRRSVTNTNYSNRSSSHHSRAPRRIHGPRLAASRQQNVNHSMSQGILYHPGQQLQYFGNREPVVQTYNYNAYAMVPTQVLGNIASQFNNNFVTTRTSTSAWVNTDRLAQSPLLPTPVAPKLPTLQQLQNGLAQREVVQKVTSINTNPQPIKMISPAKNPPSPKVKSPPPVKKVSSPKKPPSPQVKSIPQKIPGVNGPWDTVKTPQDPIKHPAARQITSKEILDEFDDPWCGVSTTKVAPPPGYCDSPPSIPEGPLNEPPVSVHIDSEDEFTDGVNACFKDLEIRDLSTLSTCVMASSGSNDLSEFEDVPNEPVVVETEAALPDWVYEKVQLVPKDMASYDDDIKINTSTDILILDKWTDICVTDVQNPHKFFFHTKSDIEDNEELMVLLDNFYKRDSSKKLTPKPHEIRPKLVVAALYNGEWHRARILTDTFQKDRRTVCRAYYVDYGTIAIVAAEDVRYLHKDFLVKPQLCHRGSLSGILPYGDTWSVEVSRIFLAHVIQRNLLACAQVYFAADRSWHIELIDPKTEPFVNINMYLIENDMAKMYNSEDLQDYMDFYKTHRPFFEELISGESPTYAELLEYSRLGIEYEPMCNVANEDENANTEEEVRVCHLYANNPFIDSIRASNIRVVIIPTTNATSSFSPFRENELSNRPKKEIPLDNYNILPERKVFSRNPFHVDFK